MKAKNVVHSLVVVLMLLCGIETSFGQAIPEEARRHFDRGTAAVEIASSKQDLENAAREFERAARLAPDWAAAHYNLGLVRENIGDLDGALTSFRCYLQLSPGAKDAGTVKSIINKIEYIKEKQEEYKSVYKKMQGVWHTKNQISGEKNRSLTNYMKMNSMGRLVIDYPYKGNSEEINRITPDFFEVTTDNNRYEYTVTTYRCTTAASRDFKAPTNCPLHVNVKGEVISSNPARLREDVVVIDPWAGRTEEYRDIIWEIND